ncbi:Crp/Fnr family transcriptional regulator [Gorillibacterium timonense]|uniref:Crp/Fnr family transcriptional regulator n=1 Tax=Gorillibacterium timonense TaxID=1689269 RepID=UPI00071E1ACA|nr:Crp/Fnr family transcriptional regulator [Gorillibacterium timonense]
MIPNPETLKSCLFFRGKTTDEIKALLARIAYQTRSWRKNDLIVTEGEPANRVGVVLEGQVEVQKIHPTGRSMTLASLKPGQTFGEAVLFSAAGVFPATVIAGDACSVMFIGKEQLMRLFAEDPDILSRYMENMSERLVLLNRKIEVLSLGTLRQRIAYDLLKLAREKQSLTISLPYSKRIWAEHLNAARPSLSRELGLMREKGLIAFDGNSFTLTDRQGLEELLLED